VNFNFFYSQYKQTSMAETKNDLIIKFRGRLDNLFIQHRGKVILNYNGNEELPEDQPDGFIKNQARLGVTSSFAKAVHSIPILQEIWLRSNFQKREKIRSKFTRREKTKPGKAKAFNKIVSANNKYSGDEHPTKRNIIVPWIGSSFDISNTVLSKEGINISIPKSQEFFNMPGEDNLFSLAAVVCALNPKRKANKKFELITKYYGIKDFNYKKKNDLLIALELEEADIIRKYKNLILYFTIICTTNTEKVVKWSDTWQVELENSTAKSL
jgi:hypothetical protein